MPTTLDRATRLLALGVTDNELFSDGNERRSTALALLSIAESLDALVQRAPHNPDLIDVIAKLKISRDAAAQNSRDDSLNGDLAAARSTALAYAIELLEPLVEP